MDWKPFASMVLDLVEPSLRDQPKYLVADHEVGELACTRLERAYTSRVLDLQLAPKLSSWQGRSFATVVRTHDHKTLMDIGATVIHELAHWLDFKGPIGGHTNLGEIETTSAALARMVESVSRSTKTTTDAKPKRSAPWANHGARFVRAACHASWRMHRAVKSFDVRAVRFSSPYYGSFGEWQFIESLKSELVSRQNDSIRDILESNAPSTFTKLWQIAARSDRTNKPISLDRQIKRMASVTRNGEVMVYLSSDSKPIETEHGTTYLLSSGFESRPGSHAVCIYDADLGADTVRSVIGSVRSITVRGQDVVGVATFASDSEAQAIRRDFVDGKRKAFSLSVQVIEGIELKQGELYGDMHGPALVATRWHPLRVETSKQPTPLSSVKPSEPTR